MNRSTKGFGLTGVLVAVLILTVSALFTTSAKAATNNLAAANNLAMQLPASQSQPNESTACESINLSLAYFSRD